MNAKFEPTVGRYVWLTINDRSYRIYTEESGSGIPLLCLHTAGADSRQYRHLLADPEITSKYRIIAFDMPYHGRSTPPDGWWLEEYKLTMDTYLATIAAVMQAFELDRPIIMGCSMGGCVVLKAAIEWGGKLRGIIGLESAAHLKGRHQQYLHHPAVHGGEMCASWTLGLNAPQSPEVGKRENWWYYAQSGPGVYAGDTAFAAGFDLRDELHRIDTKKCKVSLLTGEYDYSATPAMTREVADLIKGSRYTEMKEMGHFPISENYELFKSFLVPELTHMVGNP